MRTAIKRHTSSSGFRYVLAAPLSASLAILIPNLLARGININKDNAFYISLAVLFFINFFISYHFVFRQTKAMKNQLIKYTIAAILFRWLDATWYKVYSIFTDMNYELIIILSIGTTFIIKYIAYKFLIFSKAAYQQSNLSTEPKHRT